MARLAEIARRDRHAEAAEIEVDECAVPNVSYSDSARRGNPEMPPNCRSVAIASRRPVRILCGYVW